MDDLNFTLDDFVGSAYNPQVSITVTDEGHVVSITYMSPSGLDTVSYTVPDWSDEEQARAYAEAQRLQAEADRVIAENNRVAAEQARVAAESARVAAEQGRMDAEASRVAAEQARVAAEQSRVNAETARQQASQTAVANANAAAAAANTAASNADDKAQAAQAATVDASSAASAAASAATNAATAATAANTAAAGAADAAGAAGTAASAATGAASEAADAADSANAAADRADAAAESIEDELAQKADKDGYYSQMTVGLAENLVGRGDPVGAEYLYRTSGGTQSIEDGDAEVTEIRGNTLKWNQITNYTQNHNTSKNGVQMQVFAPDQKVIISGDWEGPYTGDSNYYGMAPDSLYNYQLIAGHKYAVITTFDLFSAYIYFQGGNFGVHQGSYIATASATVTPVNSSFRPYNAAMPAQTINEEGYFMIFDLTAMYGAGNEPATIEEFEASFPLPYYEYDPGSLLPVNMEGIETVGFNQWDIESIPVVQGNFVHSSSPSNVHTEGYIRVVPGMTYELGHDDIGSIEGQYVVFYDMSKNELKASSFYVSSSITFTVPEGASYIRLMWYDNEGITPERITNANPCLHLVWSGYRNGEYEPYWKRQREIPVDTYFPNGMQSSGSGTARKFDRLSKNRATHEVATINLHDMNWVRETSYQQLYGFTRYYTTLPAGYLPLNSYTQLTVSDYLEERSSPVAVNSNTMVYTICKYSDRIYVLLPYSDFDTVDDFLSWLETHPVIVNYPITPVETVISPELNLTYRVSDFGTERIMVDESAQAPQSAPVPMSVVYAANASDTVRRLPVDYISEKSFENFRSALASALGLTITEEFDTDQGKYVYTVEQTQTTEGE